MLVVVVVAVHGLLIVWSALMIYGVSSHQGAALG
jgi:hypothetical protein